MNTAYRLQNIHYSYGGAFAVVLPNLEVGAGQVTALIGANGAGKSTLLSLLAFETTPDSGKIRFFGHNSESLPIAEFRTRIGYLPQKPYLLSGTVRENLILALKLRGVRRPAWKNHIETVLTRVDVAELLEKNAKTLSGGETQKTALARALIHGPDVLLLDEPFAFLDHEGSSQLETFIEDFRLKREGTLVFSTHHRLHGMGIADRVVTLVDGRIALAPVINLYHGQASGRLFDTGKITIILPDDAGACRKISVAPQQIVLSNFPLVSSIRNRYQGKITAIVEDGGKVRVSVAAGELFHALITHEALSDLELRLGGQIWVNFKSNAVSTF